MRTRRRETEDGRRCCRALLFAIGLALSLAGSALWAGTCSDCGREVADASRFCGHCGKTFAPVKTCSDCGKTSPGEAKFCGHCGHKFPYALEDEERMIGAAVKARSDYLERLGKLSALYKELGLLEKQAAAEAEISAVKKSARVISVNHPGGDGEPSAPLAFESVAEADKLYEEAEDLRKSPNLFKRKENLRKALETYQKLLMKHPTSDKADDAAYRTAEIYASPFFANYESAVEYYKKCVVWNPKTDTDARYRAAEVADQQLKDTALAIEWYRRAAEADPLRENRDAAKKRLARLQPDEKK